MVEFSRRGACPTGVGVDASTLSSPVQCVRVKSTDGDGTVVRTGYYKALVSGDCFRAGKETHASDMRICTHNCGDGGEENTRRGGGAGAA